MILTQEWYRNGFDIEGEVRNVKFGDQILFKNMLKGTYLKINSSTLIEYNNLNGYNLYFKMYGDGVIYIKFLNGFLKTIEGVEYRQEFVLDIALIKRNDKWYFLKDAKECRFENSQCICGVDITGCGKHSTWCTKHKQELELYGD